MNKEDSALEMPDDHHQEDGWHLYARGGKFEEDLDRITQLLGSALYEVEQRGAMVYIRRIQD